MQYFYNYENVLEEQKAFIALLYHDYRNGQIIRLTQNDESIAQYSTCDLEQLAYTGTDCNVYTSVNTFRGKKRTSDELYNFSAMYIDLDCHSYKSENELERSKKKTIRVLEAAFKCGEIAVPTMITSTGRGFGVYYVLKHSIANVKAADNSIHLFHSVYDQLLEKYKNILGTADTGLLEVDSKVRDASRVVRMPGTMNMNNGALCHLISINHDEDDQPLYYDLKDIIKGSKLYKDRSKEGKIVKINTHLTPFLTMRVQRLQMLQEIRGVACVDSCREVMCFIMYSALVQINERNRAVELLYAYNEAFFRPLPDSELEHIIVETDNHVIPNGKFKGMKGFYPYSDYTLIKTLDITEEEIKKIGFGNSWQRQKKKEENQMKKKVRNDAIAESIKSYPNKTYVKIADEYQVSVKTVERIAKAYGVNRYRNVVTDENEIKEEVKSDQNVATVIPYPVTCIDEKTDKICNESLGVGGAIEGVSSVCSLLSSFGWDFLALTLERLFLEAISYGPIDALFRQRIITYIVQQYSLYVTLSPGQLLTAVSDVILHLAIWITDFQVAHDLLKPWSDTHLSRASVIPFKVPYKDSRFDIIEDTLEYQVCLDRDVLAMVKNVFEQMKAVNRNSFLINGKSVSIAAIKDCFNSMSYKDIVVVTERISHQCKNPENPFYYIMKVVWCYMHPDDAKHLDAKKDDKSKNSFCNFKQREYTDDFFQMLERMDLS